MAIDRFQQELGQRHQYVRKEVLQIGVRRMADFYGFNKASELECYESGEREFPAPHLNRLVEFFFVHSEFLRGESDRVLRDLVADLDLSVGELIDQDFRLFLLASPAGEPDRLVYPVLYKEERGFSRSVRGRLSALSDASGGGAANIYGLISLLLDRDRSIHDVNVLCTPRNAWERLEQGTFYMDSEAVPRFGIHRNYQQVFQRWFDETAESRRQLYRHRGPTSA